jgi:protein involved in polysaccharide export with SLBB domain
MCVPGSGTRNRIVLLLGLVALWASLAAGASAAQAATPDEYRLGKYDVLELVVPEEQLVPKGVSCPQLTVGPDGCIQVTFVGSVVAAGKTCAELAAEIKKGLVDAGQFANPTVLIRVKSFGADNISVLGAVTHPGYYPFRVGLRVREAIALAGGVGLGESESGSCLLVRSDGSSQRFSVNEAQRAEGSHGDLTLQPGDTLVVEQRAPVSVYGYVGEPGQQFVRDSATLSEVVAAAGGIDEETGDGSRVVLHRADGSIVEADLHAVLAGATADDPVVGPGDTVYVPRLANEIAVLGFVDKPGRYRFHQGDRVSDLVAAAGGVVTGAASTGERLTAGDLTRVQLTHRDGTTATLDIAGALRGAPEAQDPVISLGDTVVVPELQVYASVLGHVKSPGRYILKTGNTLADLLAAAGGAIYATDVPAHTTSADLQHCILSHQDGESIAVDLSKPELPAMIIAVSAGDMLYVPEAKNSATLLGFVTTPGPYVFRPGETVRSLVATGGGPLIERGDPAHVEVRHADGTSAVLDLSKDDLPLQPGDQVTVPYGRFRVAVLGYVKVPGFYQWHEGDTAVQMLATAGGIDAQAGNRFHAAVVRREDGETKVIELDLDRFYKTGDPAANIEVLPDDIIIVPRNDHTDYGSWLTHIRDALTITNLVNLLF